MASHEAIEENHSLVDMTSFYGDVAFRLNVQSILIASSKFR